MNKIALMFNKAFYHTVGRLSDGISMTLDTGFTSGRLLDYIYENKPRGKTFIGRWIDKSYIRHVGWEAVRIRKNNIEASLKEAIRIVQQQKNRVNIVDTACGYAAYIFSVLTELKDQEITADCYDIDPRWTKSGNEKSERLKMHSRVRFNEGNMLDPTLAAKALKDADIVLSVGFYEWITDDEMVRNSLEIIKKSVHPGSFIILTYPMSHPCLDLVQYVFPHFNGAPVRMKMRDRAEMGQMLEKIGFKTIKEYTDSFGYFNTVLGRRN